DNHKQESWKTPLPQHIENLYYKRFGKESPESVKSINQLLKEEKLKKEKRKGEKILEKTKNQESEFANTEEPAKPLTLSTKLKLHKDKPKIRIKLEAGDTPDTILQKEEHIFDEAFDLCEKENATLGELGFVLKKIHPQYKPRRYGCKTLGAIYEKLNKYEVIQTGQKGIYNVVRKKVN
ncbi:MAG: OST-HTH/LOTUS domain-containing protein, partial [Prevotella sp.]|nr:OST-HTH/LOTUS domain-containing protein [Prevotella sp.]